MSTIHKVKLHELASALGRTGTHENLKKVVRQTQKQQSVLPVALAKTQEERISRKITYEEVKTQVSVWDDVVRSNRLAEKIYYPLQSAKIVVKSAVEATKTFKPKTPLELEIAEILQTSKNVLRDDKKLTAAEEEAVRAMSLEEALERRRNLHKMRALQSYMQEKAYRKKKIKSKQYHRLLKKDRLKKQEKELEDLQLKDPQAALEKLEEIDKNRIQERMSLKHRSTGQWSKYMKIRAKRDLDARESLVEQLKISKKLTKKRKKSDDEEDDEKEKCENEAENVESGFDGEDSPWLIGKKGEEKGLKIIETVEDMKKDADYKEVWQETRDKVESKKKSVRFEKRVKESEESKAKRVLKAMVMEKKMEIKNKQKLKRKKKMADIKMVVVENENENCEMILNETPGRDLSNEESDVVSKIVVEKNPDDVKVDVIEVDFNKLNKSQLRTPRILESSVPEMILAGDDDDVSDDESVDEKDEQRMTLAEAFADDDVTREFNEEKEATVKDNQPNAVDLFLPGWGSWGGTGVKENKRKKKRFVIEPPKKPRLDDKLPHVIINEKADEKLKKLQVRELPYPYKNVKEFEKSVSAPVGQTWNAESAFRRIIAPRVETKLGAVVEPITKSSLSVKRQDPFKWKVGDRPVNSNKKPCKVKKDEK